MDSNYGGKGAVHKLPQRNQIKLWVAPFPCSCFISPYIGGQNLSLEPVPPCLQWVTAILNESGQSPLRRQTTLGGGSWHPRRRRACRTSVRFLPYALWPETITRRHGEAPGHHQRDAPAVTDPRKFKAPYNPKERTRHDTHLLRTAHPARRTTRRCVRILPVTNASWAGLHRQTTGSEKACVFGGETKMKLTALDDFNLELLQREFESM